VSLNEIAAAAISILEKEVASPRDELIRQTALALGFKATAQVRNRVASGISAGIANGSILLDEEFCKVTRTVNS
jgi:hypothetical protein